MCNTSAPYLHQNSPNWSLHMVIFMLWCLCCSLNSYQRAPFEAAVPASIIIMMLNLHQKSCIFIPNRTKEVNLMHHCRIMVQIRCQKGALECIKVQVGLVVMLIIVSGEILPRKQHDKTSSAPTICTRTQFKLTGKVTSNKFTLRIIFVCLK